MEPWQVLTELGFTCDEARAAYSRFPDAEEAANFLCSLSDCQRRDLVAAPPTAAPPPRAGSMECKMVLCVRTDLSMTVGKIAAQCAHAAVDLFAAAERSRSAADAQRLMEWSRGGQAKIVLAVSRAAELRALEQKAKAAGLLTSIVSDAGRTQVVPGTETVVGIGPGPCSLIDTVSGHLKLLYSAALPMSVFIQFPLVN